MPASRVGCDRDLLRAGWVGHVSPGPGNLGARRVRWNILNDLY